MTLSILIWLPLAVALLAALAPRLLVGQISAIGSLVTLGVAISFLVRFKLGRAGLSHMLEHMMFKGTHKYAKGEFSKIIKKNGGNDNAFTSQDYTAYFENLAADKLELALEMESDRLQGLLLDDKEFQLEREVVKEERRLRTEDNPQAYLTDLTRAWNASIARHSHQRLVMDAKLRGLFARVQEPRIIEEIRAELADKLALHGVGGISERVE